MYKVLRYFTDLQDKGHQYQVGDEYPRSGLEVSEDRIKELSSTNNKRGVALIKESIPENTSPVPEEVHEEQKTTKTAGSASNAKKRQKKGKEKA